MIVPGAHLAPKSEFKNIICKRDNMKGITWFTLQSKSSTEISWWLVHMAFWGMKTYEVLDGIEKKLDLVS